MVVRSMAHRNKALSISLSLSCFGYPLVQDAVYREIASRAILETGQGNNSYGAKCSFSGQFRDGNAPQDAGSEFW